MSATSRSKGKRAETEAQHIFERRNLPYIRQQDGRLQESDFVLDRRFAVEVKRRESLSLLAWHRHLEGVTPGHLVPVVMWRPSREPWRCSLLVDDFLDLAEESA